MGAYMNALREEGSRDDLLREIEKLLNELGAAEAERDKYKQWFEMKSKSSARALANLSVANGELFRLRAPVEGEVGEVVERLNEESRYQSQTAYLVCSRAADIIQRLAGQLAERDAEISHMKLVAKNVDGLWAIDIDDKAAAEAQLREAVEVMRYVASLDTYDGDPGKFARRLNAFLTKLENRD